MHLHGFKPGDNLTILNTYYKRFRDVDSSLQDVLTIIFKDLNTGIKYKEEIINPEMTYYIAKPDKRTTYNRLFIPVDDVVERRVPKMDLDKCVAKDLGMTDFFYDCIKSGDRQRARLIHSHPDVFNTDTNIEDQYRFEFGETYQNNLYDPSKSYFDIEVDTISMLGDFPEPGECPVNAITVIMQESMQVYTLILRNDRNPQIGEFEEFITRDRCAELKDFIRSHVNRNGTDLFMKYKLNEFSFNIAFYDEQDEIKLITDLFGIINQLKPDFVLAWNMAFDVPYLIQRIINLGYDPAQIMAHHNFQHKYAEYFIDERNKNVYSERGDYATISTYSVYLDQMIQYASRRKGQTQTQSYKLDDIGEIVAKVGKLDYKHITTSISELPYKDFKTFVYYNIMDTIVQYCIEFIANDVDYVYGKTIANNTRFQKVHRQTTYLTNRGKKDFWHSDRLIIGNNFNKNNEKPTTKFPGAFVADPTKVSNYSRKRIGGMPVNIVDNSYDFDYASLYPNLIEQFNIAANTQIGKVNIPNQIHNKENRRHSEHWERAGSFFEDFHTHDWVIVGSKWFNLPGIEAMYNYVNNYFNTVMRPSCMYGFKEGERQLWQPIVFRSGGWAPIVFDPPMNKEKIGEFYSYVETHPNQQF